MIARQAVDESVRAPRDILGAQRPGLVERRADAEAGGAGGDIVRHALGRDAADRQQRHVRRKHRLPRLDHGGRQRLARKELQPVGAGRERGEAFGRASRRRAGTRRPASLAARITSASECGMTMSLPPASTVRPRCLRRHHGAGADQRLVAEALRQDLDRAERLRRVERHLDQAEARLDQRRADRSTSPA